MAGASAFNGYIITQTHVLGLELRFASSFEISYSLFTKEKRIWPSLISHSIEIIPLDIYASSK